MIQDGPLRVMAALLQQAGSGLVYPVALASSSGERLMILSPTAQATLLLTSYFSKASGDDIKPLTQMPNGAVCIVVKIKVDHSC